MQSRATVPVALPRSTTLFPTFSPLHAPEKISQEELGLLLSLRGRLKQLQGQIERLEEESLKTRLEAGAVIEPGDHSAAIRESFRRNISWKDVCSRLAKRLGYDPDVYTSRVLNATKPTRTASLQRVALTPKLAGYTCVSAHGQRVRHRYSCAVGVAPTRNPPRERRNHHGFAPAILVCHSTRFGQEQ